MSFYRSMLRIIFDNVEFLINCFDFFIDCLVRDGSFQVGLKALPKGLIS